MNEIVIEKGKAERHYWRDVWHYHELLYFLAWRDIKVRYKQAALGIAWAVIQPAVQTVLLTFVFGKLAKMPSGNVPYPMLVLAGILPWQLFSSAFSGASNSMLGNANLISKVYFPRLVAPLSSLTVSAVDLAIMLAISAPIALLFGVYPTWRLFLLPVFILGGLLIAFGAGLWITSLTVKYRDFRFITPFLLQIGVFVTPVGYRTDNLPNWRDLLALNPLTGVVEGFRWCLLGGDTSIQTGSLVASFLIAVLLVWSGIWYFRKTERSFADIF